MSNHEWKVAVGTPEPAALTEMRTRAGLAEQRLRAIEEWLAAGWGVQVAEAREALDAHLLTHELSGTAQFDDPESDES